MHLTLLTVDRCKMWNLHAICSCRCSRNANEFMLANLCATSRCSNAYTLRLSHGPKQVAVSREKVSHLQALFGRLRAANLASSSANLAFTVSKSRLFKREPSVRGNIQFSSPPSPRSSVANLRFACQPVPWQRPICDSVLQHASVRHRTLGNTPVDRCL